MAMVIGTAAPKRAIGLWVFLPMIPLSFLGSTNPTPLVALFLSPLGAFASGRVVPTALLDHGGPNTLIRVARFWHKFGRNWLFHAGYLVWGYGICLTFPIKKKTPPGYCKRPTFRPNSPTST